MRKSREADLELSGLRRLASPVSPLPLGWLPRLFDQRQRCAGLRRPVHRPFLLLPVFINGVAFGYSGISRHSEERRPYLWPADKNSPLRGRVMAPVCRQMWDFCGSLLQMLENPQNPAGCSFS